MKKNEKKKTNKKLLSAFGMFMLSGAMLGTATYAWFTMSREVEVKNIQLTATTPEDIQIALGEIVDHSKTNSLALNTSYLKGSGSTVAAPTSDDYDWSNSADISHYYTFGKLIPASSDTGEDIFFTPDANGVGKTVKTTAKFYQAATANAATNEGAVGSGTGTLNATAHLNTATAWTGSGATAWNVTRDDGYYVDIPVWLRTSSTDGADLSVKAYVLDKNTITNFGSNSSGTEDAKELYRAVRVAILDENGDAVSKLLPVADGEGTLAALTNGDPYTGASILDWYEAGSGTTVNPYTVHGGAVNSISGQGDTDPTYTPIATLRSSNIYNGTATVATLSPGTGVEYGTPTKVIIRVWLEGEDSDCYNETAGQDWSINLMFENKTTQ